MKNFLKLIKDLEYRSTSQEHLKIIGQNIRGFDLIFIFERMKRFQKENEERLYNQLLKKPEILDFIQMHVPLNNFQIKGLNHDVLSHAYNFNTKITEPSQIAFQYYSKNYDKILKYAQSRFIYPELYRKIQKKGLVSKGTLQHSIKFVEMEKDKSRLVSTN